MFVSVSGGEAREEESLAVISAGTEAYWALGSIGDGSLGVEGVKGEGEDPRLK
jgi:hypothetical protein